jgi:hypothetical protein
MKIYFDPADWWIGYYRGPNHHYVCPLPTLVVRWNRTVRCTVTGLRNCPWHPDGGNHPEGKK